MPKRLHSSACSGASGSAWREGTADAKTLAESALNTLAAQLDRGRSTSLTTYLATMARFHRYSVNNVFLIHSPPGFDRVAGFAVWRKMGRLVRLRRE
jgi:hypothetical protein